MASRTRRAAVLGRPVAHSLSPVLHNAAYEALGLDWHYEAIDCDGAELPEVLRTRQGWAGFSCTMPVKQAALAIADEVSPTARSVGVANTLLPLAAGGWRADNTDVTGVVQALGGLSTPAATVTVLGAGGTAQAVLIALAQIGISTCALLVRDVSRVAQARATGERAGLRIAVGPLRADAPELDADLIISTLPPRAADPLAVRPYSARQGLLDVAYDPWPSRLAGSFSASGASVVSGAVMLLHQAVAQVTLMTGQPAPVPAMRAALHRASPASGV